MSGERAGFHPEAAVELRAAVEWYRTRSLRAGDEFVGELEQAIETILQSPTRWRRVFGPWRRYVLRRFPFLIATVKLRPGLKSSPWRTAAAGQDIGASELVEPTDDF